MESGFDDASEALDTAAIVYRKNLWKGQKYYVEVWCEKGCHSIPDHATGEAMGFEGISVSRVCLIIIDVRGG